MWSSLSWPYLTHGLTSLRGILSIGARFLLENSIKAKGLWPCLVAPCVWLPEATIYFHKSFTFGQLGWDCLALYGEWRREWNFYNLSLTWQYKDIKASLVQIDGVGGRDAGWRSSAGPAHLLVSLDVQSRRACVRRAKTTMVGLGRGELVDAVGRWSRGFNDCDQGCRFVILAALGAQSPLYARQPRQAFLSYTSLFHLSYVGAKSVFATIFVIF